MPNPVTAPERIIPSRFDVSEVLRSPHLVGCYGLKPIPQTKEYTCGAAAVATVLTYLGLHGNEYNCTQSLGTDPVVGTKWFPMYKLLKRRGLKARAWVNYPVRELINSAKQGEPTLIEWLDWGGHWVVHCGYEPRMQALVFADPAKPRSNFTCHHIDDFVPWWVSGGTGSTQPLPAFAMPVRKPNGQTTKFHEVELKDTIRGGDVLYNWKTKKPFRRSVDCRAA